MTSDLPAHEKNSAFQCRILILVALFLLNSINKKNFTFVDIIINFFFSPFLLKSFKSFFSKFGNYWSSCNYPSAKMASQIGL